MNQQSEMGAILWLARREITRLWVSYLMTGLFMLLVGFLVVSTIEAGALGPAGESYRHDAIFADIVILLLTTLLATNYTFWGSYSDWSNPAERKLAFMRALPIPVSTLVGSRMISLIFALLFTVPAFFLPIYLLSDHQMGVGSYLAFVAFWVGYALIWAGLNMYVELVNGSRYFLRISFILATLLIGVILLITIVFDVQIVSEVERLVSSHGRLVAPASIIVGIAAFIVGGWLTERGLREREIPV